MAPFRCLNQMLYTIVVQHWVVLSVLTLACGHHSRGALLAWSGFDPCGRRGVMAHLSANFRCWMTLSRRLSSSCRNPTLLCCAMRPGQITTDLAAQHAQPLGQSERSFQPWQSMQASNLTPLLLCDTP